MCGVSQYTVQYDHKDSDAYDNVIKRAMLTHYSAWVMIGSWNLYDFQLDYAIC